MRENRQLRPFVFSEPVAEQINVMLDTVVSELGGQREATERPAPPACASESEGRSGEVSV